MNKFIFDKLISTLPDLVSKLLKRVVADPVNVFIAAILELRLPPPPIDDSKLSNLESTDVEKGCILPTKSIASFTPLPNKYKVGVTLEALA